GFKEGEAVTDKGDWYMFDVASAAQNLMLAAVELGLGTVHVGLFDAIKAEGILKVPQGIRVVVLIPVGHPAHQPKGPGRKELHEIVFKERYGEQ
ncbi:MAG: nitroreductase family protein, partial [Dehalococcoidia bacterium]|nr:nitroreductase family protein [Dehalococcoidia bacterium]